MLIYDEPDGYLCIGQASHARASGELARRWGNDAFDRPEPFDDVCLGAAQHDVGMAEWDVTPDLDPDSGRPLSFLRMATAQHLALWTRAPALVLSQSPYAALLVSLHGHALYARSDLSRRDPGEARLIRDFLAGQERLQHDLMAAIGEDSGRARRNQRLLWALDFLSLAPLTGWMPGSVPAPAIGDEGTELRLERAGERRFTVDPWPFSGDSVTVRYEGRHLESAFADRQDLHAALEAAAWRRLELTFEARS